MLSYYHAARRCRQPRRLPTISEENDNGSDVSSNSSAPRTPNAARITHTTANRQAISTAPRIWRAPANFFDFMETDDSLSDDSSDDEPFGERGNHAHENRRRPRYPCFGNALTETDEDEEPEVAAHDPFRPMADSPNIATSDPNTTVSSGSDEYNPKNMDTDTVVPEKPKCEKEPLLHLKKLQDTLPLANEKEWSPCKGATSSMRTAAGWEHMDCRDRAYPWIFDVMEMYALPTENKDVFKECEIAGKFLVVEQFNDGKYDYAKCWIINNEFPMKMMIVPSWCFPKQKPKVGSCYNSDFHIVWHKIGPYSRRKILRLKAGATVTEETGPQSRFLGKLVRLVQSKGCWAKVLQMHVRLEVINKGYEMQTFCFRKVIFDRSALGLPFPEGAISIEGTGWIEPLPGVHGTNPEQRGDEMKLFYLTGKFAETVIQWDDPARPPKIPLGLITMEMCKELDETRYEWQPRRASSAYHHKAKKPVDERPRPGLTKNKYTKTQRVLSSIEILRRIRARDSVFGMLNPDKVFSLECLVGDRETGSKSTRIREMTMKLIKIINLGNAYEWIKEREPDTIKDMFELIKMNINYVPGRRDAVCERLRPVMFPESEESDYEVWDD